MYNPWISSKDLKKKSDKKQKSRGRWRMKTVFSHTKGKSQTTNVNTAVLRKWTDSKTPCCILNYEVLLTLHCRDHISSAAVAHSHCIEVILPVSEL